MSDESTLKVNPWDKLREQVDPNEQQDIVSIVDRSGSMAKIITDAIGGLNQFIEDQQKLGEAKFTMIQFDDRYADPEIFRVPLSTVKPLTKKDWIPRGLTALLDAVGKSIQRFNELKARGEADRVLFVIYTDGEENASREYKTVDIVRQLVKEAKKNGCDFVFLGADIDSFAEGAQLGVARNATTNFKKSGKGVRNANMYASTMAAAFRTKKLVDTDVVDSMQQSAAQGDELMEDFYFAAINKLAEDEKPEDKESSTDK